MYQYVKGNKEEEEEEKLVPTWDAHLEKLTGKVSRKLED